MTKTLSAITPEEAQKWLDEADAPTSLVHEDGTREELPRDDRYGDLFKTTDTMRKNALRMTRLIASMEPRYWIAFHGEGHSFSSSVFSTYEEAEVERQRRNVPEDWHIERIFQTPKERLSDD